MRNLSSSRNRPDRWSRLSSWNRLCTAAVGFAGISLFTAGAQAASLVPVNGWEIGGLPADISMYAYVPDQVVENPPVLVLIHYCGGTAPAVFGQAQGGGVVAAADEHGFIIIAPSSGRCWDIVSDQTRTREGGGDSHAIRQMVAHALDTYGANPERVYATGNSSGGMMTQLLLGLYPDVFQGGSAMAGMPAGCRGANENGNGGGYSGACAGGNVDLTPEEWGAVVDDLSPEHAGLRPRVQLFHGDDDDLIRIRNHTEAIEQWRDVLELAETPSEETTGIALGNHQAVRQTWDAECGYPVLDAFTSIGGDHGPSDALFVAEYLIPFLGLDQPGPIDPYVAACDVPDDNGTGGASAAGGAGGGSGGAGTGGNGIGGGATGDGGTAAGTGGAVASGGASAGAGGGPPAASGGAPVGPGTGGASGPSEPTGGDSSSNSSDTGGCNVGDSSHGSFAFLIFAALGAALGRRRKTTACK